MAINQILPRIELTSNSYRLSSVPERLGRLAPSDPAWPLERLREQYAAQGYLWLKGLLDRAAVLALRRWYFELFASSGLLMMGNDPTEGLYSGAVEDKELAHRLMIEAVRRPEYTDFCQSTAIVKFYEAFLAGPVHLYRRKLIRYTRPGDPQCTGGHYDMVYLREGSDQFCSSWIPLGDTPVEMGGLVYLEGSYREGYRLENEAGGKRGTGWLTRDLPALADRFNTRWLIADYEAGDMVVHSPYIIHASTTNCDPAGRMRLSTDIRYQRQDVRIDLRWGQDWSPDDML